MSRVIKFRYWDTKHLVMVEGPTVYDNADHLGLGLHEAGAYYTDEQMEGDDNHIYGGHDWIFIMNDFELLQFTGHQINGVDLYEDDIVRVEEDAEGVDPEDRMNWYVVTWIKEWCMFALLRIGGEYQEYIDEGTDGLDTSMFWTFPLDVEDIGFSKHFLCGNIHENSNLLNP